MCSSEITTLHSFGDTLRSAGGLGLVGMFCLFVLKENIFFQNITDNNKENN